MDKTITNNLNISNNKIINVKNASDNLDAVNLQQLKNGVSALSLAVDQVYLLKQWQHSFKIESES